MKTIFLLCTILLSSNSFCASAEEKGVATIVMLEELAKAAKQDPEMKLYAIGSECNERNPDMNDELRESCLGVAKEFVLLQRDNLQEKQKNERLSQSERTILERAEFALRRISRLEESE